MGILRTLLSPCGFGLVSDMLPAGSIWVLLVFSVFLFAMGPSFLSPSEMAERESGWRDNPEFPPPVRGGQPLLPDAAGIFMHQRLAFGTAKSLGKFRHIGN